MSALDKLVGNSTHFKIMKLYYENMDLSENISEISRIINRSHITVKKAINDLESIRGVKREANRAFEGRDDKRGEPLHKGSV